MVQQSMSPEADIKERNQSYLLLLLQMLDLTLGSTSNILSISTDSAVFSGVSSNSGLLKMW